VAEVGPAADASRDGYDVTMPWNLAVAFAATALFAASALPMLRTLRRDWLFLVFHLQVLLFLQIAPVLSLTVGERPTAMPADLVLPWHYAAEYFRIQLYCLLFFQLPLVAAYHFCRRRRSSPGVLGVRRRAAVVVALAGLAAVTWFAAIVTRQGMWSSRIGWEEAADKLVGLPVWDYLVLRTYQESCLFLIGILVVIVNASRGKIRLLALAAAVANILVVGVFGLMNSRSLMVLLVVTLTAWMFRGAGASNLGRRIGIAATSAVLAGYLTIVVVNVRNGSGMSFATLDPFRAGVFGDAQGYGRVNCVDLMARLLPQIDARGPAYGRAWESSVWLVWRFVDPAGWDALRRSLNTTSKSYLMRTYLGWPYPDYYSCELTDIFGNFHIPGLLLTALLTGWVFAVSLTQLRHPTSGARLVVAMFVVILMMSFDQEGSTLFLGWVRRAPPLLAVVLLGPLKVRPAREVTEEAGTMGAGGPR
jgi:hypothetical protein